jgi:Fe-S cluster assembly iron-binding protein IscA
MITLTANAAEVVRGDIKKEKLPAGTALRLGVVNDGCKDSNTQYRYVLELFPAIDLAPPLRERRNHDTGRSAESGPSRRVQLGVKQGPHGNEYMFLNPHAEHSCSCGTLFEVMPEIQVKEVEAN